MVKTIWEIILVIFGVQWVFPESVIEVLLSWRGSFVGKKRKKIWKSIPLCIFWAVWKERNRIVFRGGSLDIQKFKYYFVCNLWSWAKVYIGEESHSLLGFLEWLGTTWGWVRMLPFFCCFSSLFWGCSVYPLYTCGFFSLF